MNPSTKAGWLCLIFLAALGLAMGCSAIAEAGELTLVERIAALVPSLASKREDSVDPRELAEAIASVPKVTREWAALILTIGTHESALSARIAANDCHGKECDGGRAFGLFQGHKNSLNASVWGSTDVRVQTLEAARALRSGFYTCNHGKLPADWVARTINGYAGRRCDAQWDGLTKRLATYGQIVRKL